MRRPAALTEQRILFAVPTNADSLFPPMADWCDEDVDDVTYRQLMQQREERRLERELGVHGANNIRCVVRGGG